MMVALHKNARTMPAVRREIALSSEPVSVLAARYGITEQTVYKWKKRKMFFDHSHTAQRLQTRLNRAQKAVAVELRKTLLRPPGLVSWTMKPPLLPLTGGDATVLGRAGGPHWAAARPLR